MLKKRLKKIRQRPDHEKSHIVRTMALITTGAIFVIYLLILAFAPRDVNPKENTQQNALEAFSDILNSGFNQIGSIGAEIKKQGEEIDLSPENIDLLNTEIQIEKEAAPEQGSFIETTDVNNEGETDININQNTE